MTRLVDTALDHWSFVVKQYGEVERTTADDRLPMAPGEHSDPVLSEVIRSRSSPQFLAASKVDRLLRDYGREAYRTMAAIYIGKQMGKITAYSVHGPVVKIAFDGPVSMGVAAARLGIMVEAMAEKVSEIKELLQKDLKALSALKDYTVEGYSLKYVREARSIIRRLGITQAQAAQMVGMPYRTLQDKLLAKSPFRPCEVIAFQNLVVRK